MKSRLFCGRLQDILTEQSVNKTIYKRTGGVLMATPLCRSVCVIFCHSKCILIAAHHKAASRESETVLRAQVHAMENSQEEQ